jgi:hypothetical protein
MENIDITHKLSHATDSRNLGKVPNDMKSTSMAMFILDSPAMALKWRICRQRRRYDLFCY